MTDNNANPLDDEQGHDLRDDLRNELADVDGLEDEGTEDITEEEALEEEAAEVPEEPPIELPELQPHDLWPQNFKDTFPTLPREAQEFLLETHSHMLSGLNQRFNELADIRRTSETIEQALQPLDGVSRLKGIPKPTLVGMMAQHIKNIMDDNYSGSLTFLNEIGVDVNKLVEQQPFVTETEKALQQQVQQANQQSMQVNQALAQMQQAENQRAIDAFAAETDENGAPKWPRFEELRFEMGNMWNQGMRYDLPTLYKMAEVRNPAQAPQASPQPIKQPAQDPVKKAEVASKTIKSKSSQKPQDSLSLRDELRQRFAT